MSKRTAINTIIADALVSRIDEVAKANGVSSDTFRANVASAFKADNFGLNSNEVMMAEAVGFCPQLEARKAEVAAVTNAVTKGVDTSNVDALTGAINAMLAMLPESARAAFIAAQADAKAAVTEAEKVVSKAK